MAWFYLLVASLFEIMWAIGLKHAFQLKFDAATITVLMSMFLSLIFLALAIQKIPMGIAYAIWTGIGVVGVFFYGFLVDNQPIPAVSILFIGLILTGVIGLKLMVD